jgi:hypothetical protein
MKILTTSGIQKKKMHDKRMVSAWMPKELSNYLTLHSIAVGTTKSKVVLYLLEEWQSKGKSDRDLIEEIAARVNMHWKATRAVDPEFDFKKFILSLEEELIKKGLEQTSIDDIIRRVQNPWKEPE